MRVYVGGCSETTAGEGWTRANCSCFIPWGTAHACYGPACYGDGPLFGETDADRARIQAEAALAVANMRLAAMEQQRDSARRVARAAYVAYLASVEDISGTRPCSLKTCVRPMCVAARAYKRVLAEEARREKSGG